MERLFNLIYLRLRNRPNLLYAATLLWVFSLAIIVTVGTAAMAMLYLDLTTAEWLEAAAVGTAVALVGISVAVGFSFESIKPVLRWIGGEADRPAPDVAWQRIHEAPLALTTRGVLIVSVLHLLITDPYVVLRTDLPAWSYLAVALAVQIAVFFTWVLLVFAVEFALRPVAHEIDRQMDSEVERPLVGWRLPTRMLLPIPAVAAAAGLITGAAAQEVTGTGGESLIAAGVGAVVVGLLMTPLVKTAISDPLVRPIEDLKLGADRAAAADFGSRVAVTGSDEVGALGSAFNRMQLGLKERETLRSEREGLLGEIRASRARILAASDAERRRVERNIHDGAQQRLVALALKLRMAEAKAASAGSAELREDLKTASEDLSSALAELRELARGLHPQILSTDGLKAALEQLGSRASVPVKVEAPDGRFPDSVESTAYFVVSEALANVGKYAQASQAQVSVARRNGALHVEVADDGVGGADPDSGSGLSGLRDRVAALDGSLQVESEPGGGTRIRVALPLAAEGAG